jgi:hypothetical protein
VFERGRSGLIRKRLPVGTLRKYGSFWHATRSNRRQGEKNASGKPVAGRRNPGGFGKGLDLKKKFLQYRQSVKTARGKLTMAFRRSDLQEAFFVPGTHPFRVWGYGTADPLEEVLSEGYFRIASGLLRQGELIYVSARSRRIGSNGAEPGEPHMALVMIGADERDASRVGGSVRLVQDFGRPSDRPARREAAATATSGAAMPPAPVKRRRGRPPGSRNKRSAPAPAP